eukprot:193590-Prorocentrum_minimum.AAC.1
MYTLPLPSRVVPCPFRKSARPDLPSSELACYPSELNASPPVSAADLCVRLNPSADNSYDATLAGAGGLCDGNSCALITTAQANAGKRDNWEPSTGYHYQIRDHTMSWEYSDNIVPQGDNCFCRLRGSLHGMPDLVNGKANPQCPSAYGAYTEGEISHDIDDTELEPWGHHWMRCSDRIKSYSNLPDGYYLFSVSCDDENVGVWDHSDFRFKI